MRAGAQTSVADSAATVLLKTWCILLDADRLLYDGIMGTAANAHYTGDDEGHTLLHAAITAYIGLPATLVALYADCAGPEMSGLKANFMGECGSIFLQRPPINLNPLGSGLWLVAPLKLMKLRKSDSTVQHLQKPRWHCVAGNSHMRLRGHQDSAKLWSWLLCGIACILAGLWARGSVVGMPSRSCRSRTRVAHPSPMFPTLVPVGEDTVLCGTLTEPDEEPSDHAMQDAIMQLSEVAHASTQTELLDLRDVAVQADASAGCITFCAHVDASTQA